MRPTWHPPGTCPYSRRLHPAASSSFCSSFFACQSVLRLPICASEFYLILSCRVLRAVPPLPCIAACICRPCAACVFTWTCHTRDFCCSPLPRPCVRSCAQNACLLRACPVGCRRSLSAAYTACVTALLLLALSLAHRMVEYRGHPPPWQEDFLCLLSLPFTRRCARCTPGASGIQKCFFPQPKVLTQKCFRVGAYSGCLRSR